MPRLFYALAAMAEANANAMMPANIVAALNICFFISGSPSLFPCFARGAGGRSLSLKFLPPGAIRLITFSARKPV